MTATEMDSPAAQRGARPADGLARYGRPPYRGGAGLLIHGAEAAGLTGRGGAAFPVHRKMAIVASARGRKVIVANGAESEPASRKDALLLRVAPNLVLDGLQLAAEAIGASEAHLYLHPAPGPEVLRALAERASRGLDRLAVTITRRASTGSTSPSPRLRPGSWPARSRRWSTGWAAAPRCPLSCRPGCPSAAWAARPRWCRTWRPWLTWR